MEFKFKETGGKRSENDLIQSKSAERETAVDTNFEEALSYKETRENDTETRQTPASHPEEARGAQSAAVKPPPARPIPERFEIYGDSFAKRWLKRLAFLT
ncbi:MAG TPA: hypothetical protein VGB25_05875, partial [Candidatus Binatia bacterium]